MSEVRVLILADDPLARAGLAALLSDQPEIVLAGQAATGDDLPGGLDIYTPDVIAWDMGWDPGPIPEALVEEAEDGPPIVALVPDEAAAAEAWTAGARAVLPRSVPAETLVAALVAVAHGLAVLDPALAIELPLARPAPSAAELTARELDVLRLLAEGLPNKAIAQRLAISEHTVKFHLNAILGKLGAQSRTEAVVQAIRRGLIGV